MTWRAYATPDMARIGRGVAIHLGIDHGDGSFTIAKPAEVGVERQEPEAAATFQEPFLRLTDDAARAILDALSAHYGGTSDTRQLRKDYEAERARVDRLLDALRLPVVSRGAA